MDNKLFHRGLAVGEAFCNRSDEIERLSKNIHKIAHTLLISPRRYGKTSLALRAIEHSGLPHAYIDLFMKYDAESVIDEFYINLGRLLSTIIKPTESALRKIESMLKNLNVSIRLEKMGFEFMLAPRSSNKKNIKLLLLDIDELLGKQNQRVIIFIDEIQELSQNPICSEVESALRFVAQKTSHISFIFSGSHRALLRKMFDDRSRPLYKLCHTMNISRISQEHYKSFINKFASRIWKQKMLDMVIDEILISTQCHPYYVNVLCGYLFEQVNLPNIDDVKCCWERVCREEQSSVAKEIEFLTIKQKQLLVEIANHPGLKKPTAKHFVDKVSLTPKGILGAIEVFEKFDLVERGDGGEIFIIDPVLIYWSKSL